MQFTVGIKINNEAKAAVISAMQSMRDMGTSGSFTDPEDLILPMVETNDIEYIDRLKTAVDQINAYEFPVTLDRIHHHGAVYWIEIMKNDYFTSYSRYLYERLRYAGIDVKKRNRNETPHIIVSRNTVIPRKSKMPAVTAASMNVRFISIMLTELSNKIPFYTELYRKEILTRN